MKPVVWGASGGIPFVRNLDLVLTGACPAASELIATGHIPVQLQNDFLTVEERQSSWLARRQVWDLEQEARIAHAASRIPFAGDGQRARSRNTAVKIGVQAEACAARGNGGRVVPSGAFHTVGSAGIATDKQPERARLLCEHGCLEGKRKYKTQYKPCETRNR